MQIDRETCELLRAIASCPKERIPREIAPIIARIHDWDATVKTAQEHGVLAMLYPLLADQAPAVPAETLQLIRAHYEHNAFHSLANALELVSVLKTFDEEGIPVMPFKGVVLGSSVYHDLTTRPAGDLDLLIFYHQLRKATAILLNLGYELKTTTQADGSPAIENYYEYHFERESDGRVIELRWRLELTQPRFRRNLGMDWVWPTRRVTTLAGAEVPDLDPVATSLVLCMHGSKHRWSRLIWICDVARFLRAHQDLDWKLVQREAKRTGLWRALALGVLLAHRVADAPVPQSVLDQFSSDGAARQLALHFDENLFSATGSTPRSRVPYNVQLLGPGDRVRLLLSLGFLRPNGRDLEAIHLPKLLYPLYYLIRPFRVLLDRSAR